jgi:hypothetical protein
MQPRVFVSSTYYDLKYVRDRIELFLKRFNFEPVLFESDKVTFEHNKPLDSSCYEEVKLCQMFILIVGGRYGSPSTGHKQEEFQKRYEDEFVSITRKEYETAIESDMPSFIFIDKNVYSEYQTFKKNQLFFEQLIKDKKIETKEFSFAHVDNQNIFYFIDSLQQKAIKQFDTVDEIENYLSNQFSGMFFLYLKQLQERASNQKILDTINELNSVVNRMNTMVDGIGKEVIKQPEELKKINEKQFDVIVDYFISTLFSQEIIKFEDANFSITSHEESQKIADVLLDVIFKKEVLSEVFNYVSRKKNPEEFNRIISERQLLKENLLTDINHKLVGIDENLKIADINVIRFYKNYYDNIKPFMTQDSYTRLKNSLSNYLFFIL